MGATRFADFARTQNDIARFARALAHPARIAILERLLESRGCVCGELVTELPLAQATVSQHLKELREAGLLKATVRGNSTSYCVNPEAFVEMQSSLGQLIATAASAPDTDC